MSNFSKVAAFIIVAGCGPVSHTGPTWFHDIKPIVDLHCATCHAAGGAAGVAFDEHSAPALSGLMVAKVEAGDMPPWLPGGDSPPFAHDPRLSEKEIALLRTWARNPIVGAPRASTEVPAGGLRSPTTTLLTPPYRSTQTASDEVRCFLLHPPAGSVVAYSWRVGDPSSVHHFAADVVSAADASKLPQDPMGWDCPGTLPVAALSTMISTSIAPGNRFAYPDGYGAPIPQGAGLVLSVHVMPLKQLQADVNGVELWYADKPVKPVSVWTIVAPSDLPCPPSIATQPQCQRAYAESRALTSDLTPKRADILRICGGPEIPGEESGGRFPIKSSCVGPLNPGTLRVMSVRLHAHTRTVRARLHAQRPNGDWFTLLDIPRYQWRWEGMYVPLERIDIKGAAWVECEFDNGFDAQWSALTNTPSDGPGIPPLQGPQMRVAGLRQSDEMCMGTIEWVSVTE